MSGSVFEELVQIMARLRAPDGCPWDQEQTMEDLARYIREESDEVADAIAGGNPDAIRDELGDLLFNIIHAARIGEERGEFTIRDVITATGAELEGASHEYRLQAITIERVGEAQAEDGQHRILVRSPEISAGQKIITTQLPRAISGLLVEPA